MLLYESKYWHAEFPYYVYVNAVANGWFAHNQDYYELFITYSDSVIWSYGNDRHILPVGTFVFICPGKEHYLRPSYGCELKFINLSFTEEEYFKILDFLELKYYRNMLEFQNIIIRLSQEEADMWIKRIRNIDERKFPTYKNKLAYCRILLSEIVMKVLCIGEYEEKFPSWLNNLCDWLKKDMHFSLSLDDVSEQIGKSKEYLSRAMKKYMNISPTAYMNTLRLEYVSLMLKTTKLPISELYLSAGFFSASHFNQLFKKKYGISAKEYRKQNLLYEEM